jgi:hypothetical protein
MTQKKIGAYDSVEENNKIKLYKQSQTLIKELLITDIIEENNKEKASEEKVFGIDNLNEEENKLINLLVKNNKIDIENSLIEHIKNIYNINNNDISKIITYAIKKNILDDTNEWILNLINKNIIKTNKEIKKEELLKIAYDKMNITYENEKKYNIIDKIEYIKEKFDQEIIEIINKNKININKVKIKEYEFEKIKEIIKEMIENDIKIDNNNIINNIINKNEEIIIPIYIIKESNVKNIIKIENTEKEKTKNVQNIENKIWKEIMNKMKIKNKIIKKKSYNQIKSDIDVIYMDIEYINMNNNMNEEIENIKKIIEKSYKINKNIKIYIKMYDKGNKNNNNRQ